MWRPFNDLRKEIFLADLTHKDMAEKLGMSERSFSFRMCAQGTFSLDEMYDILDILNIDYSEMPRLFPKGGGTWGGKNHVSARNDRPAI